MCCCMVLWVLFRVPTTTHFSKVCCCMVLWVLFRVPTTTHFNKVNGVVCRNTHNTIQQHICCCGYSKQHPQHRTTNTFQQHVLLYGVVGVATHNTIQQHILLKCVVVTVVGTRNNTHNTIQHTLLMLLLCVTYGPS